MRWKWIAGTVFFLIIALMAAIYVFLYTFDYNKLKPRIARMVKDATGRELNIGGEIDLEFGLFPALVVTDTAVRSTDKATLDRIKLDPAFVEQALGSMHPGMSLMITDLTAGPETRSDRDFVIVTSEFVQ